MFKRCFLCTWALVVFLSSASQLVFANSTLHEERSVYSNILVIKRGNTICLQFDVRNNQRNQSCQNQKHPKKMVFAYTKMSMASLLFAPNPQHILIIGLGGGTLPMAFHELYPNAIIDNVEIDPAVTKVAKEFFGFTPNQQIQVFDQDARVWVKRAALKGNQYDIIVLDAFNGEYIPEHLMTQEFLQEVKQLLMPNGVVASNTFTISDLYHHESATYAAVYPSLINFKLSQTANRVIMSPSNTPPDEELIARAKRLAAPLKEYDVPIESYARRLIRLRKAKPDWDTAARILTDQYSPANLLQ